MAQPTSLLKSLILRLSGAAPPPDDPLPVFRGFAEAMARRLPAPPEGHGPKVRLPTGGLAPGGWR